MIGKVDSEALKEIDVKKQVEVGYKAPCVTDLQNKSIPRFCNLQIWFGRKPWVITSLLQITLLGNILRMYQNVRIVTVGITKALTCWTFRNTAEEFAAKLVNFGFLRDRTA